MKKSILTLCILIATPVSQAVFDPIEDDELGAISGQAGVTIDTDFYATIGSLEYKDEGSVSVNNIVIGGANDQTYFGIDWGPGSHSGDKLDGSLIKIDVQDDGDLVISGGVDPAVGGIIDFGITTGTIQLQSADKLTFATLVDSINISGVVTKFRMKVDAATSHILTEAQVGISDLDIDISGLNMKVENAFLASSTYFESVENWGAQGIALADIVATIEVDIYADDEGLHINPQSLEFDMGIGSLSIADAPIGSFYLNNVNLTQTSMTVSGHP
jgi:hypothetical protein